MSIGTTIRRAGLAALATTVALLVVPPGAGAHDTLAPKGLD